MKLATSRCITLIALTALLGTLAGAPLLADPGGAKTAVTLWWVVFNSPENCATSPCSGDDLAAADGSVFYASGALVPANDRVRFVASLYETAADFSDIGPFTSIVGGPGLVDALAAEIHIVVRTHGPAIAGQETEQITLLLEPSCQQLGGPNECKNIQFAIHVPDTGMMSEVWRVADGSVVDGASSKLIRADGVVKAILETRIK